MSEHTQQHRIPLAQVKHCVAAISAPTRAACQHAMEQIDDWEVKLPLLHGYLFDSFIRAAETDILRFCQNLCYITDDNHMLTLTTQDHLKLIHLAARHGFLTVIDFLLSIGETIDCPGPNQMTALWVACRNNKPNTVSFLLSKGATMINWQCSQTKRQISATQIATVYKHHRVLNALQAYQKGGNQT
jgi:ankyrin repeat protein